MSTARRNLELMHRDVLSEAARPEPCLAAPCASASECNGWGYCRERNRGGVPSRVEQAKLRAAAAKRRGSA